MQPWRVGREFLPTRSIGRGAGQTWTLNLVHHVMAVLLENDSLDHFLTRLTIFQLLHHICSLDFEAATAVFAGLTGGNGLLNPSEALGVRLSLTGCARWF